MIPSIVTLGDLKDNPSVRMDLPGMIPIGEKLLLRFVIRRKLGPRTEELRVDGEFKVTSSSVDARGIPRQMLVVEATKVAPSWKAIKNLPSETPRRLPPTHSKAVVRE